MANYYEILGVASNATSDEIRGAYKRLCRINHPDKGGTAQAFQAISEAYEVLSDPVKRLGYDEAVKRPPDKRKYPWFGNEYTEDRSGAAYHDPSAGSSSAYGNPSRPTRPEKPKTAPKAMPRVPSIDEIYTTALEAQEAQALIQSLQADKIEVICSFVISQYFSTNKLLKDNAQLLLSVLIKPQSDNDHTGKAIDKTSPEKRHMFIVDLLILCCDKILLIDNDTLAFLRQYFLKNIPRESQPYQVLQALGHILKNIYKNELQFIDAFKLISQQDHVKKDEDKNIITKWIIDFIKRYLNASTPYLANNAKHLMASALAAENLIFSKYRSLSENISPEFSNYFNTLTIEQQNVIIKNLLTLVHSKGVDDYYLVKKPCAVFLMEYLIKANPHYLPIFFKYLYDFHKVFLNYQMSFGQYLLLLTLNTSGECEKFYFKQLSFDVQSLILGSSDNNMPIAWLYSTNEGDELSNSSVTADMVLAQLRNDRRDPSNSKLRKICNFIINNLHSSDQITKNKAAKLLSDILYKDQTTSAIIHQLDAFEFNKFMNHLLIILHSRAILINVETKQLILSHLHLNIADSEAQTQLLNTLGRVLQTIYYTSLRLESAYALIESSPQQKSFDEDIITRKKIFEFIANYYKSDDPHLSKNAKCLIFAGLFAKDRPGYSHVMLSKYIIDENISFFYSLNTTAQDGIIDNLLNIVNNICLGFLDEKVILFIFGFLERKKPEFLPQFRMNISQNYNITLEASSATGVTSLPGYQSTFIEPASASQGNIAQPHRFGL